MSVFGEVLPLIGSVTTKAIRFSSGEMRGLEIRYREIAFSIVSESGFGCEKERVLTDSKTIISIFINIMLQTILTPLLFIGMFFLFVEPALPG
jgi:hypothetical protein